MNPRLSGLLPSPEICDGARRFAFDVVLSVSWVLPPLPVVSHGLKLHVRPQKGGRHSVFSKETEDLLNLEVFWHSPSILPTLMDNNTQLRHLESLSQTGRLVASRVHKCFDGNGSTVLDFDNSKAFFHSDMQFFRGVLGVFGTPSFGVPDFRVPDFGVPGGRPGAKTSVRPSTSWKSKHFGADIHDSKARTSMTPGGVNKKLRSEKLFPN